MKKESFNKNPKVSIIIPVYNGEKYVTEAIDSALAQTYKNIEIIVVNDGSKDNTDAICKKYGNKIKYYKKENGGVSTALNLAIEKMTGDYFSWLSHDDTYLSNKIEEEIKYIKSENDIILSDYCAINENSTKIFDVKMDKEKIEKASIYGLLAGNLNGITLLIPKKAFEKAGNFDESLRCTQDYDLWFKMLQKEYKFKVVPKILACSRQHAEQTTYLSPNTIFEGNNLWMYIVANVKKEDIEILYGDYYNFYLTIIKNLFFAKYIDAYNYVIEKAKNEYPSKVKEIDKYTKKLKVSEYIDNKKQLIKRVKSRNLKENIKKVRNKVCKK